MKYKLRDPYRSEAENHCTYRKIRKFLTSEKEFTKGSDPALIINEIEQLKKSRVWLLFAKDGNQWLCMQAAQSKYNALSEIRDAVSCLLSGRFSEFANVSYGSSAFYENVCPKIKNIDYREGLYKKIGEDYSEFKICFLDVDQYLGIDAGKDPSNDAEHIVEICKNQYAEAKVAYQLLAVYWRQYNSGIDGQTISYIAEHKDRYRISNSDKE